MFLRHVTLYMHVYLCAILLINWRVKRRESLEPNYRTANSQQRKKNETRESIKTLSCSCSDNQHNNNTIVTALNTSNTC